MRRIENENGIEKDEVKRLGVSRLENDSNYNAMYNRSSQYYPARYEWYVREEDQPSAPQALPSLVFPEALVSIPLLHSLFSPLHSRRSTRTLNSELSTFQPRHIQLPSNYLSPDCNSGRSHLHPGSDPDHVGVTPPYYRFLSRFPFPSEPRQRIHPPSRPSSRAVIGGVQLSSRNLLSLGSFLVVRMFLKALRHFREGCLGSPVCNATGGIAAGNNCIV